MGRAEADDDLVVRDERQSNFTSLDLDGNCKHAMPEDTDDWAPEDFAS